MTDDEALKFYEELVQHYGDSLANFEYHPKQFKYQVTCYKYYKDRKIEFSKGNDEINSNI